MTEVQQSLPHQAYQFALIDKQWRELMFSTARNPNVMQLCCKAGEYQCLIPCPLRKIFVMYCYHNFVCIYIHTCVCLCKYHSNQDTYLVTQLDL